MTASDRAHASHRLDAGDERPLAPVGPTFLALAETFVPEMVELEDSGRERVLEVVESGLRARPPSVSRQLRVFVRLLDGLARLRYGRGLSTLSRERRTRLLETMEDSPVRLLRQGIWGLRTLAFMGYYTREDIYRAIGYRPEAGGWESRGLPGGQPRERSSSDDPAGLEASGPGS